jgi:hypothetical protein
MSHYKDPMAAQIDRVMSTHDGPMNLSVLELLAGSGELSKVYTKYGSVLANEYEPALFEKLVENTKDSGSISCQRTDALLNFHQMIASGESFDIIDINSRGLSSRYFPDVFLLIKSGILFLTMVKPSECVMNRITSTQLTAYFGSNNPTFIDVANRIAIWGICHWRKVELIDMIELDSEWRFAFNVERVNAKDYVS